MRPQDESHKSAGHHTPKCDKSLLYPRPDLLGLQRFLQSSDHLYSAAASGGRPSHQQSTDGFAVVHDIASAEVTAFGCQANELDRFVNYTEEPHQSYILFLRGYASPKWLNAIGHHHEVGADFYQRHLDYQTFTSTGRNFFTSPGLPSTRMRVFQLPILTICTCNVLVNPYEPENLKEER